MRRKHPKLKPSDVPTVLLVGQNQVAVTAKKMEDGEYGEFAEWDRQINININQPPHMLKDTLIHEWLHAVLHMSGITALTDSHHGLEEAIVRAVTSAILPAMDIEKLRPVEVAREVSNKADL